MNAIIYRALQAIENGLLSTPPQALGFGSETSSANLSIPDADGEGNVQFPEAREEIENGVHQLETLLEATVDKTFDKFEIYTLRNILTVPDDLAPWIRLAHYGVNIFFPLLIQSFFTAAFIAELERHSSYPCSDKRSVVQDLTIPLPASAPTAESILALRHKLQEAQKVNLALEHEHARHAALLSQLQSLVGQSPIQSHVQTKTEDGHSSPPSSDAPLSFLASQLTGTSPYPFTTSAQFTTAQLPALRALVAELRPQIATLRATLEQVDGQSGRERRRGYIDGVARRVVRESGVEDRGEELELGRRVVGDEVRNLEDIVQVLGTGGEMEE